MKKLLSVLMAVLMLIGILGCSNQDSKEPEKPEENAVKGEEHDIGRISVLVPEGWSVADLGSMATDFTCVIVKGTKDDFMKNPQVSIIYNLPTEVVVSSAAFFDNVIQQEPFDLGGYHWTSWTGSFDDLKSEVAEAEGDFGYLTFSAQEGLETKEMVSLKDPEVQAMISSVKVRPTIDVDWISITDGKAVAQLAGAEGQVWEDGSTMVTQGVEASFELDGNTVTLIPTAGTGAYMVTFNRTDTDATMHYADASIGVKVENGKVTGIYDATVTVLETPEEIGGGEWTDDTDYEAIDRFLIGAWSDNPNGLTMFIQKYEEIEHGFQVTIQAADRTMVAFGHVDTMGTLWYDSVSINGAAPVESDGWLMTDGPNLLWGHDEAVGTFDNANIFSKAE